MNLLEALSVGIGPRTAGSDEAARAADVLVCSGASTAPAITGAVVEEGIKTGPVERIEFGIMPGNDAPRGPQSRNSA